VVAVNEHEVHRLVIACGCGTGRPQPVNLAVAYRADFAMGDVLLHAESKASDRKRIHRTQHSLGVHRGPKPFRRHAVPYADLGKTLASRCVLSQTVTLRARRLRRRRREAEGPGDVMREDLHVVSMAGT
jgi:hypothetical protein